jgi:hypothetical protein
LVRARSPANGLCPLNNKDRGAGSRQGDGCGEAVWPRADDYSVVFGAGLIQTLSLAYLTP